MICYVFTCQTVPLFFTVTKFGIALPKWIIERENSIWVS
jgi:preprotein translocase subunit Sec63